MREYLSIATIVVVSLMVGVELSVAVFVNPIFDRLPNDGGIAARSDGARVLGRWMPFWYIGSVLLSICWAIKIWGRPQAFTVIAAVMLLVVSIVMSVTILVPINTKIAHWSSGGAPKNWREQVNPWDRFHYIRVGIIVVAFVLLVAAGVT
jgi:uncharacterized membrane protein